MRFPALPAIALSLSLLGCGASVSRIEGDVPATTTDAAVLVDAPVALDVPVAVDVPSRPDVPVVSDVTTRPDVPMRPDVATMPMCPLQASVWDVDLEGMRAVFEFTMDDRWIVTADGRVVASGVYELMNDQVTISGEMSDEGCSPSDRGTFQLRFTPDCTMLQLALVHDDCAERGDGLERFRFTRR